MPDIFEKQTLASAAAQYSAKNVQLSGIISEIERKIESILSSDYPGDDLQDLLEYIRKAKKESN